MSQESKQLAALLQQRNERVVFAESCTAGLVAAMLAGVEGISDHLCGSAVTYRAPVKRAWLRVSQNVIDEHTTESEEVARAMARGVLDITAEADWSAAIVGHLGPEAPEEKDGVVYIAVARRGDKEIREVGCRNYLLQSTERGERQREAALRVMDVLAEHIREAD